MVVAEHTDVVSKLRSGGKAGRLQMMLVPAWRTEAFLAKHREASAPAPAALSPVYELGNAPEAEQPVYAMGSLPMTESAGAASREQGSDSHIYEYDSAHAVRSSLAADTATQAAVPPTVSRSSDSRQDPYAHARSGEPRAVSVEHAPSSPPSAVSSDQPPTGSPSSAAEKGSPTSTAELEKRPLSGSAPSVVESQALSGASLGVSEPAASPAEIRDILLQHDASNDTWGISVKQGLWQGNNSLYVSDVGSPIVLSGHTLHKGDKLVRVNGADLSSATVLPLEVLAEALQHPTVMLGVQKATEELEFLESGTADEVPIVLQRRRGDVWGFSSTQSTGIDGDACVVVAQVVHGGWADQAGLKAGDRILSVTTASGKQSAPALDAVGLSSAFAPDKVEIVVERATVASPIHPDQLARYVSDTSATALVVSLCATRASDREPWGVSLQSVLDAAVNRPGAHFVGVTPGRAAAGIVEAGDQLLAVDADDVETLLQAGTIDVQHKALTGLLSSDAHSHELRMVVRRQMPNQLGRKPQMPLRSTPVVAVATENPSEFKPGDQSTLATTRNAHEIAKSASPTSTTASPTASAARVEQPASPIVSFASPMNTAASPSPSSTRGPETSPSKSKWRGGAMATVRAVARVKVRQHPDMC